MDAQELMAGYDTYTTADELAMDDDNGALAITPTMTSSVPCSAISAVSIDNTFDHWC
ncbi:LxmA leader domain family RiPP [uncultured Modestobacter sp.]|uniref:LxmA leader domain family RiPP n=1 Tax=uncultured Modestobacter sp. TaxID=380048 RepID=UPI00261BE3B7|nr:LxmA leader domain family RiPP [uncultured Modestobacter sp.]